MTTDTLPEPLVPAEVDLTDYKFMPLEVNRLLRSKAWLKAKRRPELGFYMMNLWAASWHEIPAASLDDDDEDLADKAMCDPKRWPKVKADVMRGWIKCSDGRLYHDVVAEKALEAWDGKRKNHKRTAAATEARKNKKNKDRPKRDGDGDVNRNVERNDERGPTVTSTNREGEGDREGRENLSLPPPPSLASASGPATPAPAGGGGVAESHKEIARRAEVVRQRLMVIVGVDENRKPSWAKLSDIVGWLQAGADPDLDIVPAAEAEMARRKARNDSGLIGAPAYLTDAVMRAKHSREGAATAGGQASTDGGAARASSQPRDLDGEMWEARMLGLRDKGFWLGSYGPLPGERGCNVPAAVIARFGLDDPAALGAFLARHRAAA